MYLYMRGCYVSECLCLWKNLVGWLVGWYIVSKFIGLFSTGLSFCFSQFYGLIIKCKQLKYRVTIFNLNIWQAVIYFQIFKSNANDFKINLFYEALKSYTNKGQFRPRNNGTGGVWRHYSKRRKFILTQDAALHHTGYSLSLGGYIYNI